METVQHLGIDVSSSELVCCLTAKEGRGKEFTCGNDEAGAARIIESLGEPIERTHVVVEATSRFHMRVARALQEAGARVQVLNPRQARSLAVGLGVIDKDDKVDARVLARAAELLTVRDTQLRNRVHEELRDISRLIVALTDANAQNKKRLSSLDPSSRARALLKDTIKVLKAQIRAAKAVWKELLASDEEIKRRYELAVTVDDVGPETARIAACELPARLEEFQAKQLCAYAAVVPRRDRSGATKRPDKVGKTGNSHLRTGLFMSATRTVFTTKRNEGFYNGLRAKGRTHKQAMIAVIHRVLRQIVAVLKRGTAWTKEPPASTQRAPVSAVTP